MKTLLAAVALLQLTIVPAHTASIGDPAPAMTIERWIKGAPVRVGPGTNIYVVEFWATWCAPCQRSIPHLTELQKKYTENGVVFVSISDETFAKVSPFVAGKGDTMNYRVAIDPSKRSLNSWMTAFGASGIPHAFIVGTNGLVWWHDFPNDNLDRALKQILAGTFDIEKAKQFETGDRLVEQYAALFWSAQDAEVDAHEGGNYVWTADEVRSVMSGAAAARGGEVAAEMALSFLGLDLGPNFRDPHLPDAPAVNVLFQPRLFHEFAAEAGAGVDEVRRAVADVSARLMAVRDKRKQPGTDDKVITAWNGMMIGGLAMAGRELSEDRYTQAAAKAADYILAKMRGTDGGLLRTMRAGAAKIPAFLDDYAFFVHGLLELYRTTKADRWLTEAELLLQLAVERFAVKDEASGFRGGYYDTLADQADLFVRTRSMYDGAIASGNSQMVHNWIDLFEISGNGEFLDRALVDLRSAGASMKKLGVGMTHMHEALLRAIELAPQRQASREESGAPKSAPKIDSASKPRVLSVDLDHDVLDLSSGEASVTVTLNIGAEYHINAHDPGADGLIATSIGIAGGEHPAVELDVQYPPGTARKFDFADHAINVYEGSVQIRVVLRRRAVGMKQAAPKLMLSLQLCTEMSCLEPRQVELPVEIVGLES